MNDHYPNRRKFLRESALVAGTALLGASRWPVRQGSAGEPPRSLRLGAPVFERHDDPQELALAHRKLGYRAAYCPSATLDDKDRIRDVRQGFARHDVVIAEVGRWCNLLDPDGAKRAENLRKVTEGLALADEIGARCCVDIAGSFNRDVWYGPHPENLSDDFFDAAVENARKIIEIGRAHV